jgi:hypothetical protein
LCSRIKVTNLVPFKYHLYYTALMKAECFYGRWNRNRMESKGKIPGFFNLVYLRNSLTKENQHHALRLSRPFTFILHGKFILSRLVSDFISFWYFCSNAQPRISAFWDYFNTYCRNCCFSWKMLQFSGCGGNWHVTESITFYKIHLSPLYLH